MRARPDERSKMINSFNEYLGKDFGASYKFLKDAQANKKFGSEKSNSGKIFILFSVIILLFTLLAMGSDSKNTNQPTKVAEIPSSQKNELPKKNDEQNFSPKNEVVEEKIKPEPVKSEPIKQNPTPKPKKVEPIPKRGVYTGYDYSQEILNDDGLCEFTVDNTRNDMPVYVRIWDMNIRKPVRAFTIAQGEKFTAENLSPGRYEVRYKELYENDVPAFGQKSEQFSLEQYETFSGTRYSIMELTLYKVVGGNTTTTLIDADDV